MEKPRPATPDDGVAWITGASSGIGRETARQLIAEGWTVYGTARSEAALEMLAAETGGRFRPAPGDVTDTDGMAAVVREVEAGGRPIALAILNAGVWRPVTGEGLAVAPFAESIAVNLCGVVNGLVPVADTMAGRRRGQVVIVSSVAGYGGLPTSAAYGATKAGLTNLAECLRLDLDSFGILVQVVHPGFVETPATDANPFPMPFIMKVDDAARRLCAGLKRDRFEIAFPRRFVYALKLLNILPYRAYFALVRAATRQR